MYKNFGKICFAENKYWFIENSENFNDKAFFCSPIYNSENKLEIRQAGANWLYNVQIVDYPKYKEVIQDYINKQNKNIKLWKDYPEAITIAQNEIKYLTNTYL